MSEKTTMDENVLVFISECREMIDEVEPHLIQLSRSSIEKGKVDSEVTNLIFRLFHSIKGTAGFLQFNEVVKVTHEAETLLDLIRNGKVAMDHQNTNVLCKTCDIVNSLLSQIESTGMDMGLESEVASNIAELSACINQNKTPESLPPDEGKEAKSALVQKDREELPEAPPSKENTPETFEDLMMTPEMIQRFVEEAIEQIEQVEQALLNLKETPDNMELIRGAFRLIHSFKGNCGFSGYADLERLSHKTETVLDNLRDGLLTPDGPIIETLLHMVDVFNQAVVDISRGGVGNIANIEVLQDLLEDIAPARVEASPEAQPEQNIKQPESLFLLRDEMNDLPSPDKPPEKPEAPDKSGVPLKSRSVERADIRVNLTKLDELINLVGELVIADAMVARNPDLAGHQFENFERAVNHLNKIVRDLQDITLSIRMVPISGVFRKMIRLVHDLSVKAKKKVNLQLSGEDTEIDKTVSELIADPLVHLVRNAIDHGIESPEERMRAGKEETGEVLLEAKHEGGEIWITIRDDGRGLDRERIIAKGLERGLITGTGETMTDQEVFELIFQPGFSTADKVTDVSGRGVGMDVVKKNIEKIKGSVDIHSKADAGSMFIMRIPLTLAIIEGMLIRVGKARYTIPMLSIRESIQIDTKRVTITMDGDELIKVRDDLVPIIRLHKLHKIQPDSEELHNGLLVIVEQRGEIVGLLVDEILGEQQTVIKGLSNYIGNLEGVSGCTILGDGEISLILDIGGLISKVQTKKAA